MVQVVTEHVNAAISLAAHQADVWSTVVEGQIRAHQQPPYNHSTGQPSVNGELRGHRHWEIPGIINNLFHCNSTTVNSGGLAQWESGKFSSRPRHFV